MLPADPASRAGSTPEASGDSSSGTFAQTMSQAMTLDEISAFDQAPKPNRPFRPREDKGQKNKPKTVSTAPAHGPTLLPAPEPMPLFPSRLSTVLLHHILDLIKESANRGVELTATRWHSSC